MNHKGLTTFITMDMTNIINALDLLIIFSIFLAVLFLLIRTDAFKIIAGLVIVFIFYQIAVYFDLSRTTVLLSWAFKALIPGAVIIFYPELRMALKKIGGITSIKSYESIDFIKEIEKAVFSLSDKKTGALIVFDNHQTVSYQSNHLVPLNATCTKELLETIFHNKTPLHDGAVILQNGKIAFAGSKLKFSGATREGFEHLGTRHHVALETAEEYDVKVVVVSEETGNVSIVTNQGINRIKTKEEFRRFFIEERKNRLWNLKNKQQK